MPIFFDQLKYLPKHYYDYFSQNNKHLTLGEFYEKKQFRFNVVFFLLASFYFL